jgi:hypothetical protein
VAFQVAEVAISKKLFAGILRMIAELRPPPIAQPGRRRQARRCMKAVVRQSLEGAFGRGFEDKVSRITEAVFTATPWKYPKFIEAGGKDGMDFAAEDFLRLQHSLRGQDTSPTSFAPTRLMDVLKDFADKAA